MKKTFLTLLVGLFVFAGTTQSFWDVTTSHENYMATLYLEFMGIIQGYDEGSYEPSFKPDNTINRAEFTKIIIAALFSDEEIEDCGTLYFSDTPVGDWYIPYLCIAAQNNIISGYPDGSFKPAEEINFAEASKILSESFAYEEESNTPWYRPFIENLEDRSAIPTSITDFDQKITRGEMAEMMYRLLREINYKETQRFFTDQPEVPSAPAESSCGSNTYTMAFIVLTSPGEGISNEDDWIELIESFEEEFFRAADYRVKMEVEDEPFVMEIDESMINTFYMDGYESGEYSIDELEFSDHLDISKITSEFYERHEDEYDLLTIYLSSEPKETGKQFHSIVRQNIEGIGLDLQENLDYGSEERLLGINWMEDKDSISGEVDILIHETGHQWCCYAGDIFGEGETLPIQSPGGNHQYMGLDGPDSSAVMGSTSSYYVFNRNDQTYLNSSTYYSGATLYHPFVLYYMGVLPAEYYDTEYDLYDVEEEDRAIYYGSYSVNDIIDFEGPRSCEL